MSSDFEALRGEFGFPGDEGAYAKAFRSWAALIGAISLEVFGQYGSDTLTDPAEVHDLQISRLIDMLTK